MGLVDDDPAEVSLSLPLSRPAGPGCGSQDLILVLRLGHGERAARRVFLSNVHEA